MLLDLSSPRSSRESSRTPSLTTPTFCDKLWWDISWLKYVTWWILLLEECGLSSDWRMWSIWGFATNCDCLDFDSNATSLLLFGQREPNSIRVHWDHIVWRLNYNQWGEGDKTTSSFPMQMICRLDSFSYQSLVRLLRLLQIIMWLRFSQVRWKYDYIYTSDDYVVQVCTYRPLWHMNAYLCKMHWTCMHACIVTWIKTHTSKLFCGKRAYPEVRVVCTGVNTHTRSLTQRHILTYLECIFCSPHRTVVCVSVFLCLCLSLSISLPLWHRSDNVYTKIDQKCPPELVTVSRIMSGAFFLIWMFPSHSELFRTRVRSHILYLFLSLSLSLLSLSVVLSLSQ